VKKVIMTQIKMSQVQQMMKKFQRRRMKQEQAPVHLSGQN
jgi:uncharacterized membrane protein (DUF106 family)